MPLNHSPPRDGGTSGNGDTQMPTDICRMMSELSTQMMQMRKESDMRSAQLSTQIIQLQEEADERASRQSEQTAAQIANLRLDSEMQLSQIRKDTETRCIEQEAELAQLVNVITAMQIQANDLQARPQPMPQTLPQMAPKTLPPPLLPPPLLPSPLVPQTQQPSLEPLPVSLPTPLQPLPVSQPTPPQSQLQPTVASLSAGQCSNAYSNVSNLSEESIRQLANVITARTPRPARQLYDLPYFDGKPEDWPGFIATYTQSTAMNEYTLLDNLMRLKKCLAGAAREEVMHLLIQPEHVNQAIHMLERKFGRPELMVNSQIQRAKGLAPIPDDQLSEIVPFASTLASLSAFLDMPATRHHLANPTLVAEIVAKLPVRERVNWLTHAEGLGLAPTLQQLSAWLDPIADRINVATTQFPGVNMPSTSTMSGGQTRRVVQKAQSSRQFTLLTDGGPVADAPRACGMCNSDTHIENKCRRLLNLTISERWNAVRDKQLCIRCLSADHEIRSCTSQELCGMDGCSERHNWMLHAVERRRHYGHRRRQLTNERRSSGRIETRDRSNDSSSSTRNSRIREQTAGRDRSPALTSANTSIRANAESHPIVNPFAAAVSTTAVSVPPAPARSAHTNMVRNIEFREPETLFRVLPVKLHGPSTTVDTFAILDEGSSITIMDEELANQLQLNGPERQLDLNMLGARTLTQSRVVTLGISGAYTNATIYSLRNVQTAVHMALPTQSVRLSDLHTRYHEMRCLPIAEFGEATPKILIGLDHYHLGLPERIVGGTSGGAVAAKTKLGWVVYGTHPRDHAQATVLHIHVNNPMDAIEQTVREYFTTENFGVYKSAPSIESDEEAHARSILASTTARIGNRFQTGLLWKAEPIKLPLSRQMALSRLLSIERKMANDAEYARQYRAEINGYLAKGYARQLTERETRITNERVWYLPHFGVTNPNKPGKFRLVFDAAAAVKGVSLNSALCKGPDLNRSMPDILFAFRKGIVGVCGDICEMFHQVRIQEKDQDAQRFLWRNGDASKPVATYVMTAMTFGSKCSPCSAQYVKNVNAEEHRGQHNEAASAIINSHYVDDYVASFPSVDSAIEVTSAVREIHRKGGFHIRSFVSNSEKVLSKIADTHGDATDVTHNMEFDVDATDKILGLFWQTSTDEFVFRCRFHRVPGDVLNGLRRPTKREMLSLIMSIFDPFGMLSNFMIAAKLLIQETWSIGVDWDGAIPDVIYERWSMWQNQLPRIADCALPRCYSPSFNTSEDIQLHLFADASQSAFSAVGYWRIRRPDGGWDVAFVIGKTRCAPKKMLSVPRLELQAAVLAVRLACAVRVAHPECRFTATFWTDARTVTCWIRSHMRRFQPFVAHRISEILEDSAVTDWRWIPTDQNVADEGTRAVWPLVFDARSRWLMGPDFLRHSADDWPQESSTQSDEPLHEEIITHRNLHLADGGRVIEFERYSDYGRLRRIAACMCRFIHNARTTRENRRNGLIEPSDVCDGENMLSRIVQIECFDDEFTALSRNEPVSKSSEIYQLRPYIGDGGVIRMHGRIDAAQHLSEQARRPTILPKMHMLTNLMVQHYHAKAMHQNDELTICTIRERFWIPHIRSVLKRVKHKCQQCRITRARPSVPLMGPLPADRLTPFVRPFSYTGIDYFGPVFVSVGRRREKRWVALFTCLTVRAIHLELAADLSTDACILCIRNFVNLRGVPVRIRSDNGTNFAGASRELRECVEAFDQTALQRECCNRGIEWRFNCPSNPEAGGCWERLVRTVKRVLSITLTETAPRVETLRSLLYEAANIVNGRPLTHLPVNGEDEEPLTPNHFLLGGTNSTQTPSPVDPRGICLRKQWRLAQSLKNRFWRRWVREYLPELTRRTKNFAPVTPLKNGDLVIICDSDQARNKWMRGRIIEVFPGADGQVRSARVKTAHGDLRRPACKLAILDVAPRQEG